MEVYLPGSKEVNFDGLPGPFHNYGGLSLGNIASARSALSVSNPRAAVLQALNKMKTLVELGAEQAVIPPHERPDFGALRSLGFTGADKMILAKVTKEHPELLGALYSSSFMWTANAATVSPSQDTGDNRLHITPANMPTFLHRSIEADFNYKLFRRIFQGHKYFEIHHPLPRSAQLCDEGAANHLRLCPSHHTPGLEVFVYGKQGLGSKTHAGPGFPARQTKEASMAIARLHGLNPDMTIFLEQSPEAIDMGVFHNDVICVTNEDVLLAHETAFQDFPSSLELIKEAYTKAFGKDLFPIVISQAELTLEEAVKTYLFNSQLITLPRGGMILIAPVEASENERPAGALERITKENNPIEEVLSVDIRQSMRNGGGPACLRLRVVMSDDEIGEIHQGIRMDMRSLETLEQWAKRNYRDRLDSGELGDPRLLVETRQALDELTGILGLGSIYPFQVSGA
jgi:succinylarginine dihydrolase